MAAQNYSNHRRFVPMFHGVLFALLVLTLIGASVNLYESVGDHERIYSASLLLVLTVCSLFLFFFTRTFALKAQDRAIHAEERLRHYLLTGKTPDVRLTIRQIIGLRFASDEELPALARKAADESLSEDAIKRAVRNWRADLYRA
jgi:hypothetical protein